MTAGTVLPRVLIAAPSSQSGKTMVTCGILTALKRRGIRCASFKCGPDYIDPMFHRQVLGIPGRNLDSFFTDGAGIRGSIIDCARQEECQAAIIEGVMGYYDGIGGSELWASTYEVAKEAGAPVILVVNAKGASLSAAAMVKGFLEYRSDSGICGVICNQMSKPVYEKVKPKLQELGVRPLGCIPYKPELRLESRHLGLTLPEAGDDILRKLNQWAEVMEEYLDLDGLLEMAAQAKALRQDEEKQETFRLQHPIRIGVARDRAFCFYYQENMDLLEQMGAALIPFSPLEDKHLPHDLDGLLFGGGYPELYAGQLSDNTSMLKQVRDAYHRNLPMLAECGGFLYLHRELEDEDGRYWPMAGIIDGRGYKVGKSGRFGYITLSSSGHPWLPEGESVRGHEFHYWDSEQNGQEWLAVKPSGCKSWPCMVWKNQLLAGFPHLYYPSAPRFAERFLRSCEQFHLRGRSEVRYEDIGK